MENKIISDTEYSRINMVEDQPKLFKKTLNMMWKIHRIESGLGSKLVHHIESPAHWLAMVGKRIQPLLSHIAGLMNDE